MRLARATVAGAASGGVIVFAGLLLTMPFMAVFGRPEPLSYISDRFLGGIFPMLLPSSLLGAGAGLILLVPYCLYRDQRPTSFVADVAACLTIPAMVATCALTINLQSHVKRHPDALFTFGCLVLMAIGSLVGLWLLRTIMGSPMFERPIKIFEA